MKIIASCEAATAKDINLHKPRSPGQYANFGVVLTNGSANEIDILDMTEIQKQIIKQPLDCKKLNDCLVTYIGRTFVRPMRINASPYWLTPLVQAFILITAFLPKATQLKYVYVNEPKAKDTYTFLV